MIVPADRRSWALWLYPLGLVIAGLLAYANSFQGVFILDDRPGILGNPRLRRLWPPWEILAGTMRPVVELSLAVNYAVGTLNPWGYHLVNVSLHLWAGLLLYGLARRTLSEAPCGVASNFRQGAHHLAFAISTLWIVHPLITSAVAYIIQRAEVFMGCCYLATLYAMCRGWQVPAVAACALGMLSKPVMVTCPLMALLYDRTFLSGSFRAALKQHRGLYAGLAMTWGLLAWLLVSVPPGQDPTAGFSHPRVQSLTYAMTQPGVILHYLRLAVWPHPLVLDYDWPPAASFAAMVPSSIGVLGLVGLTLWMVIRRPALGFLGVWVFGILAPTSSIIPLSDFVFEHRMYLPLAGVLTLIVLASATLLNHRLALFGLAAAVVGLGLLTAQRTAQYRSELALWADTLAKRPLNARAHMNVGYLLAQQGDFRVGLPHALEGVRLRPEDKTGRLNLGYILAQLGRQDEAVEQFLAVLKRHPNDPEAYNNLGLTMVRLGRIDEAILYYRKAIDAKPHHAGAYNNLGRAYQQLGQLEEAAASYRKALMLDPELEAARENLRRINHANREP